MHIVPKGWTYLRKGDSMRNKLKVNENGSFRREGEFESYDLTKIKPGKITGFTGYFYKDAYLNDFVFNRNDKEINFVLKKESFDTKLPTDNFSAKWECFLNIDHEGLYTFYTISDDGVRLFVDNTLLIDNWTAHGETEDRGEIYLKEGWYTILINYNDTGFDAIIKLMYSSNTIKKTIIPENKTRIIEKIR